MQLSIISLVILLTVATSETVKEIRSGLNLLKNDPISSSSENPQNFNYIKQVLLRFLSTLKRHKRATDAQKSRWHKWTEWSACSATCGKGRAIRWRHCRDNCQNSETEMEEVACQLPDCAKKLFGLIKL